MENTILEMKGISSFWLYISLFSYGPLFPPKNQIIPCHSFLLCMYMCILQGLYPLVGPGSDLVPGLTRAPGFDRLPAALRWSPKFPGSVLLPFFAVVLTSADQ